MAEDAIVLTGDQIEVGRWLAIRAGLKLQATTGMTHSRGSMIAQANKVTGKNDRTARKAHASMNALIVEVLGPDFDKPLP